MAIGFQVGALIQVRDGQDVGPGEVLARIPVEGQKTATLPAVCRAWPSCSKPVRPRTRVRWPKTGTMSFGKETKGQGPPADHRPRWQGVGRTGAQGKNILVHEGQVVNKGESIVDGPADPQDILRLLGIEELSRYIVDEVQDVYRLQGVKINDKHIEVIVRQMLRRVVVENPARRTTSRASRSSAPEILNTNEALQAEGKIPHDLQPAAGHHQGLAVHRLRSSPRPPSRKRPAC